MASYNDYTKAYTAEDLIRRYNLNSLSSDRKTISETKESLAKTDVYIQDFADSVNKELTNLQDQVDGTISTWFLSGVPTLENEPASNWVTEEELNAHLGDLYYDKDTGYAYRFASENDTYVWLKITDTDVTKALAIANAAQDTADSKRQVFVITPTPPYDVGDLWIYEDTDLYRCRASRSEGDFSETDWVLATDYSNDDYAKNVEAVLTQFQTTVETDYATKVLLETTADSINSEVESVTTKVTTVELKIDEAVASMEIEYKIKDSSNDWATTYPTIEAGETLLRRIKYTLIDGTTYYSAEEELTVDSAYLYIAYSENEDGNPMTTAPTSSSKYMGVVTTNVNTAPTSYSDYTWFLIKGEDGASGNSTYLHIKYSDDGETFTPEDDEYALGERPGAYIGQYTDFNEEASTTFENYTWYKFTEDIDDTLTELETSINSNSVAINNSLVEINDKLNTYATLENIEEVVKRVETLETDSQYVISVTEDIIENGVTKLATTKGFTFDDDGLTIDETNSPTKLVADTNAIVVTDKTGGIEEELLFAGYDEDLEKAIVRVANIWAKKYFSIGNINSEGDWRMEIIEDETYGTGLGFFYMGDDN